MSKNIPPENLSDVVMNELLFYKKSIVTGMNKEAHKAVKNLVKKTKDTAPVGRREKHYKNSISSKKLNTDSSSVNYLWYVKAPDYRLSHLLNNGHVTRDGGRVKGTGFITTAEKEAVAQYEKGIEEVIKSG